MSVTGRVGSAESCWTAASHRVNALRSNGSGPQRVLYDIQGFSRRPAEAQLAPQAIGPRPCLQQVHNPTAQRRRCEPECRPANHRGSDDPNAERLAQGFVDDRPVVRADEEASFGDQGIAFTDRGLPDGVAEAHSRDGRPGGSNTLANPSDTATREPDPLHEAADLTTNPPRHVLEHGSTVLSTHLRRLKAFIRRSAPSQRRDVAMSAPALGRYQQ